jgi:hypothetical protein
VPARGRVTTLVAAALVLGPLLASLGGIRVPEPLLLPRAALSVGDASAEGRPARPEERVPAAWRSGTREDGRRVGALARRPGAGGPDAADPAFTGLDAPFLPVPEGTPGALPRGGLVLRVLGPRPPLDRLGPFALLSGRTLPASPFDLDGVDVVQVPAGLDLEVAGGRTCSRFVRRGARGAPAAGDVPRDPASTVGAPPCPTRGPAGVHVAGLATWRSPTTRAASRRSRRRDSRPRA